MQRRCCSLAKRLGTPFFIPCIKKNWNFYGSFVFVKFVGVVTTHLQCIFDKECVHFHIRPHLPSSCFCWCRRRSISPLSLLFQEMRVRQLTLRSPNVVGARLITSAIYSSRIWFIPFQWCTLLFCFCTCFIFLFIFVSVCVFENVHTSQSSKQRATSFKRNNIFFLFPLLHGGSE